MSAGGGLDGGSGDSFTGDPEDFDDGDSGGGGGSGGGGSGGVPVWGSIVPDFLSNNTGLLRTFLTNPRRFIVGAVAATILETLFGVVTQALNVLQLIFGGSAPGRLNAPGETLGIVDVPVYIADRVGSVGSSVGNTIIIAINNLNEPIFAASGIAGPLSPLVIAAVVIGETIVVLWLLQRLVFVIADLLQLGGLTE